VNIDVYLEPKAAYPIRDGKILASDEYEISLSKVECDDPDYFLIFLDGKKVAVKDTEDEVEDFLSNRERKREHKVFGICKRERIAILYEVITGKAPSPELRPRPRFGPGL
jgi:uncharacterized protein YlzI (FlbEa/FlbD family)